MLLNKRWYKTNIPIADDRFAKHLTKLKEEEEKAKKVGERKTKMKKTLNDYLQALPKERRAKVEQRAKEILAEEMTLQELRKAIHQSQQKLAQVLKVQQGEISKIEHRTDMYVSTLRDYIQAMGGTLEIIASFPNRTPIKIVQFEVDEADIREPVKV